MAERPLLFFPTPERATREKRRQFFQSPHRPSHDKQGRRLSPLFRQLQSEFAARRLEVHQTAAGVDPEQVLVIETVGSIEDFANAVKKVPGLEWLGEVELEDIAPDEDFYDEQDKEKALKGRLYLVMTNQQALQELLSLWQRYKVDPKMGFQRGLTKFRDVFQRLKDIRRWGIQDRIDETGLLQIWREELEISPDKPVHFEAELWFRNSAVKRREAEIQIRTLAQSLGGSITTHALIEEIGYHAILGQVPANAAQEILDHPDIDFLKADNVMFYRPVGQMATSPIPEEGEPDDETERAFDLPSGDPLVAILDGVPLANHTHLAGRIIVDDPDNFEADYQVNERWHGTAMASIVIHGDLEAQELPLKTPVYVRPVMKPMNSFFSPRPEHIPPNVIVVDYIHRAVRRIFEGEGDQAAAAPTVRIINISIGDKCRQFTRLASPLAKLLDWLSIKYQVMFVISAGNHIQKIVLDVTQDEFDSLSSDDQRDAVVKALYSDVRNRRLLSPAESINGITVGALHFDSVKQFYPGTRVNIISDGMPSPVSAFGSGYRRSVKPDIVYHGGRAMYSKPPTNGSNAEFQISSWKRPPGIKAACPSQTAGDVFKASYSCGTSNSAALISRMAALCHSSLYELTSEAGIDLNSGSHLVPILKAMLVHGASWGDIGDVLHKILQPTANGKNLRAQISRWLGYGLPDNNRVMECTEQRATAIGFGQVANDEANVFKLPLPPSLGARRDSRRLTVTLAWLSPIACHTQKYRSANLWFEIENSTLAPTRQDAEWRSVRRGTIHHEVFEGDKAVPISDGDELSIKVNCRQDATNLVDPVPFGLLVTLEVADGIDIAIYDEIRTRIAPPVQIRPTQAD